MIKIFPYEQLGHRQFGWLDARYHFSFSEYHNAERMGFGALRVVNDDIVRAGAGFPPHPHKNMEIITYVRKGAITHRDSMGNEGRTEAGDVQVMSAGTGVTHSEYNREMIDTNLYQIWIIPRDVGVKPRWDARAFPKEAANDMLPLLVSGRKEDQDKSALYIHADAAIYGGRLAPSASIRQPLDNQSYVLISEGNAELDGQAMKRGDGAEITEQTSVSITTKDGAEIIIIDVPPLNQQ